MALTPAQQAQLLFKQSQGKSSTNVVRDFFEEPRDGRPIVYPQNFWAEAVKIPLTAPGGTDGQTTGVVTRYISKSLTAVLGTTNSFYDASLVDCIPFNTGDGSYNYALTDSAGTAIPFGQGDWLVDPNTGTLTFYGTVPANMPPKISFYKYVGIKGALPPRYTTSERDALVSPFAGQQIYNTTTNQVNVYSGTAWAAVGAGGGSASTRAPVQALNNTSTSLPTTVSPVDGVNLLNGNRVLFTALTANGTFNNNVYKYSTSGGGDTAIFNYPLGSGSARVLNANGVSFAVSFSTTNAITANYAQWGLNRVGSPGGNVFIQIHANSGGTPGAAVATSSSVAVSSIGTTAALQNFTFPGGFTLAANTTYFLAIHLDSGYTFTAGTNYLASIDAAGSPVSGVNNQYYNGTSWSSYPQTEAATLYQNAVVSLSWSREIDGAGMGNPTQGDSLVVTSGNQFGGTTQIYNGSGWITARGLQPLNFMGPGSFDTDVENWYNFNDTSAYVDGVGGTATNGGVQAGGVTTLGSSNCLAWGPGSQAFQGFSKDVVIPGAYQGSILEFSFHYTSYLPAQFNDGDLKVIFYDIDHGVILQPTEGESIRKSLLPLRHRAKVQMPAGYSATSMNIRVSIYQTNTNIGYGFFFIDNVTFSPQVTTTGFSATDLINAGVNVVTATTTAPVKGTIANDLIRYRKLGDHAHIKGEYKQTAVGSATAGSGDLLWQLPTGLSFDSSKVTFYTAAIGTAAWPAASTLGSVSAAFDSSQATGVIIPYDAIRFRIGLKHDTGNGNGYNHGAMGSSYFGFNSATALSVSYDFMAPIAGWSSNTAVSSDTGDGKEITAIYGLTTAQAVAANSPVKYDTRVKDTSGSFSSSTGLFTAPVSGTYLIAVTSTSNAATNVYVMAAGVGTSYLSTNASASNVYSGSTAVSVLAGQTIGVYFETAGTAAAASGGKNANQVSITRVNTGSQQIGAEVTIAASYYVGSGAGTFAASNSVPINFDSREYDSHGSVTTSTTAWRFTSPAPGTYTVRISGTVTSGTAAFQLYKNANAYKGIGSFGTTITPGSARDIKLLTGDYIDIRPTTSVTVNGGFISGVQTTSIEIIRTGNY